MKVNEHFIVRSITKKLEFLEVSYKLCKGHGRIVHVEAKGTTLPLRMPVSF
jgi:uncharacterized protein YxjI